MEISIFKTVVLGKFMLDRSKMAIRLLLFAAAFLLLLCSHSKSPIEYFHFYAVFGLLFLFPGAVFWENFFGDTSPKLEIYQKVPIYLIIGIVVVVLPLWVTGLLSVRINAEIYFAIVLILSVFGLKRLLVLNKPPLGISQKLQPSFFSFPVEKYLIFFFYIICFRFLLDPTRYFLVAPLHDPSATSLMASSLAKSGFDFYSLPSMMYHYPIAFPLFSSLVSSITGMAGSKTILILSNLFVVFSAMSFATFMSVLFRSKNVFFIASFLFIYFSPSMHFFYLAGKNSQSVAYAFLFVLLTLLRIFLFDIRLRVKITLAIVAFFAVTTHFGNAYYVSVFFSLWALLALAVIYNSKLNLSDKTRKTSFWLFPSIVLFILFIVYYMFMSKSLLSGALAPAKSGVFGLDSFYDTMRWFKRGNVNLFGKTVVGFNYFAIMICAGVAFSIHSLLKKDKHLLAIWVFLLWLVLQLLIQTGLFEYYGIVFFSSHYSKFYFYISVLFIAVFGLYRLTYWFYRRIQVILLISFFVLGVSELGFLKGTYRRAEKRSFVKPADLIGFKWVEENLEPGAYVLPGNIQFNKFAFIQDSVLYLQEFTDIEPMFSFTGGEKFYRDNPSHKKLFFTLVNDHENVKTLQSFNRIGVRYIVFGANPAFGSELSRNIFDSSPLYRKIYDQNGFTVYDFKVFKNVSDG